MTTSRQFADSEGNFGEWHDHPEPCARKVPFATPTGGSTQVTCGAAVKYREWDSSDGAYTDYQYRCESGHTWWIDGIDS